MKCPSVDFDRKPVFSKCDVDPEAFTHERDRQVADPSGDTRLLEQLLAAPLRLRFSTRTALA